MLNAHGVEFVCLKQNYDTTSPQGRLFVMIMMALAEFEREQTSERTREAAQARAARGLWTGGQLLGYDLDPDHKGHLIPNEAEAAMVNAAFDAYLTRGSIAQTAAILNRRGYRTKAYTSRRGRHHAGAEVSTTSVQHLLKNVAYLGQKIINVHSGGRDDVPEAEQSRVIDAVWPAIVDEATFEHVQTLMTQNGRAHSNSAKPVRHVHVLRDLIHCGCCRGPMVGRSGTGQHGKTYFYYVCADKACGFRVSAPELEGAVLDRFAKLAQDATLVADLVQASNRRLKRQRPALLKRKRVLERSLAGIKAHKQRVIDKWANSPLADVESTVADRLRELERRQEDLHRGLAGVEADLAAMARRTVTATNVTAALGHFHDLYACLRPYEQRDLMRLLVSRVEVRDREVVLELFPDACGALMNADLRQSKHPRFQPPIWLLGQDSNLQPCG